MRDFATLEAPFAWPVLPKARESRLLQDLRAVRALIKRGWTGGTYAVDRQGYRVSPRSSRAAAFCLKGAYIRVAPIYRPIRRARLYDALYRAAMAHGYSSFVRANDCGGRRTAYSVIEAAIAHEHAR